MSDSLTAPAFPGGPQPEVPSDPPGSGNTAELSPAVAKFSSASKARELGDPRKGWQSVVQGAGPSREVLAGRDSAQPSRPPW